MYESFFRFTERPFAVLPDSSRIFWTEGHRNAFSLLEVGLDRLSQVTVLTGGVGTGKTTLIRHLLQTMSGGFTVGLLSNFAGERDDLLPWVLSAFGLNVSASSEAVMFRRLERFFAGELAQGRRSVLIVDEAQNLSERDIESLRLLGNLNADRVLMMLVLVGQPQLRAKMARVENQRLCQRIGADYHLEPLSQDETALFVRHRCVQAGGSDSLFDREALDEVHRVSGGVPRKINVLCDLALVSAYAEGLRKIDYRIVRSVLEDARRHGTYMSLTEHDIVAVAETGLAVGAEDRPPPAAAVRTGARDPVQRLTLVLESHGGGPGGSGRVERAHGTSLTSERAAAAARPGSADLNALFQMTWPDDTLLFVSDAADGAAAPAPLAESPAAPTSGSEAPGARGRPGANDPMARAEATGDSIPTPLAPGVAGAAANVRERQSSPPSPASASVAELALRQAFAPQPGWRRIGWRGGAIAALAAGGSMAAGIALTLLPDTPAEGVRQAAVAEPSTVPSPAASEGRVLAEAPSLAEIVGQAAAADPARWAAAGGASTEPRAPGTDSLPAEAHEASSPPPEEHPSLAENASRFSPVALAYRKPAIAEIEASGEAVTSRRPQPAAAIARPARDPSPPLSTPPAIAAEGRPIRLDQPRGLGQTDGTAEAVLSMTLPRGTAGSPPARRAEHARPAFVGAGTIQPSPETVPAAIVPGGGRGAESRIAVVTPRGAEPLPRDPAAASPVQAGRSAPARPAAPALQGAAGSRVPPRTGPALLAPEAPAAAPAVLPAAAPAKAAALTVPPDDGATAESDPEAMFRHALDAAMGDPRAAVIGYARAALLGHERAAYYLGQIYETGDGVPVDLAIARHWYEAAATGNPRARDRLARLPRPERDGAMTAPLPLLAQRLDSGQADFVWTSGEGADPASYVIEVTTDPGDGAVAAHPVTGSAARLVPVEGATHWRVRALDGSRGGDAASDWRVISPAGSERSAAATTPAGHL